MIKILEEINTAVEEDTLESIIRISKDYLPAINNLVIEIDDDSICEEVIEKNSVKLLRRMNDILESIRPTDIDHAKALIAENGKYLQPSLIKIKGVD